MVCGPAAYPVGLPPVGEPEAVRRDRPSRLQSSPAPADGRALLTASVLAAWAITRRQPSWQTLAALLPQQAILTASAYAAAAAVVAAHYGDGVIRPRPFILADQAPVILIFALHTAAVVEMHARQTTAEVLQATLTAMDTEAERLRPPGPSSR